MKTIEQINAEIAALQAELEARKSEPDLSEAVEAYKYGAEVPHAPDVNVHRGLIAAYPALHKVLGPRVPWPSEDELQEMADKCVRRVCKTHPHSAALQMARLLMEWQGAQVTAPEPTEAEDLAMAQEVFRSFDYLGHVTDVIVAAFKAERKRAGGGK
jgi:hypothetical protein